VTASVELRRAPTAARRRTAPAPAALGVSRRLARLGGDDGRAVIVGFDHAVSAGALPGLERLPDAVELCLQAGADALQLPLGGSRWIAEALAARPPAGLALRIDRSSYRERSPVAPVSAGVAEVQDAVRLDAQAAVVFYLEHPGDPSVANEHAAAVGAVATAARDSAMPLMIEALDAGAPAPGAVLRVARVAFELGADLLKIDHPGDDGELAEVLSAVGVPVLLRGGPPSDDVAETLRRIDRAVALGVSGVVMGRTVWQASDPSRVVAELRRVVHGEA